MADPVDDNIALHRIGGGSAGNLAMKPNELTLAPPGISVHQGITAADSAEAKRRWFPRMAPKGKTVVGSSTVGEIRKAGFDVMMDPTKRFPQHARLIHPDGAAGFTPENLEKLAKRFNDSAGL